jgi:hypothetical protein
MTDPITTALAHLDQLKVKRRMNRGAEAAFTINAEMLDDIITALEALQSEEWVAVPREPTEAQDAAGHAAFHWFNNMTEQKQVQHRNVWQTIYRAMIGAK